MNGARSPFRSSLNMSLDSVCTVQSFSEYTGFDATELTFPNGAIITVTYQDPSGWWSGFYQGAIGNLPSNFVNVLPERLFHIYIHIYYCIISLIQFFVFLFVFRTYNY